MLDRLIERALRETEGGTGHRGAKCIESAHCQLEPPPSAPKPMRRRNSAAAEGEGGERMGCDHVDAAFDLESRDARIDHEGADAAGGCRAVGAKFRRTRPREDAVEVRDPAVGYPGLLAVQHVASRRRGGRLHCMAATSDPASGSDSAKAAMASPAATRGRYRACNCGEPAREIAPLPSPCMANAKSARPSCHASVSRISASAANVELRGRGRLRGRRRRGLRHRVARPAGRPELAHQRAAGFIDRGSRPLRVRAVRKMGCGPCVQTPRKLTMYAARRKAIQGSCERARGSISLELRFLLGRECPVGAAEILGLHA